MKCAVHEENDAIGTCASCGRGVCNECKQMHDDIIHCRECVKQGRIVDKPQLDWRAFFYTLPQPGVAAPRAQVAGLLAPDPIDEPDQKYFRVGQYGAVAAGLVLLLNGLVSALSVGGSSGLMYIVIMAVVVIVASLPLLVGLYGIYRNYGSRISMVSTWSMAVLFMVILLVTIVDFITLARTEVPGPLLIAVVGWPLFGIGYILVGFSLFNTRRYFIRGTQMRSVFTYAPLGITIGGILLTLLLLYNLTERFQGMESVGVSLLPILMFALASWFIIGISMILMYFAFRFAPLPQRMVDSFSDDTETAIET